MNSASVTVDDSIQQKRDTNQPAAFSIKLAPHKTLIAGASIFLAASGIIAGSLMWHYAATHEGTDDAYVDGNVTQISSRITGTVLQVLVSDNANVKAGQTLVVLDPRDYKVKVAQAEAALTKAERQAQEDSASTSVSTTTANAQEVTASSDKLHAAAEIADAKSNQASAAAALAVEEAKLQGLQAQQQEDALDLQRYTSLVSEGAISKQQYDQSKTQNTVAVSQVAAESNAVAQARANLARANAVLQEVYSDQKKASAEELTAQADEQQSNVKQYQTKVSQAAIAQAKADLQNALLQESYTTIVAPVSGHVGKKAVQPGEQIQSGQQLLSIVPDTAWVTANFKETQLEHIRPHESVDITLDTFPDHHFKGYVDSLSPASGNEFALLPADNATGNFTKVVQRVPVKIAFDEKSIAAFRDQIIPGLSAQVSISTN